MNRDTLITTLQTAAARAREDIRQAVSDGREQWAYISQATIQPFALALLQHESIAAIDGRWYSTHNSAGGFRLRDEAVYLIDRALENDPAEIVDDLLRFTAELTIEVLHVRAVEGLQIDAPLDLGEGCAIVPPSSLPDVNWTRQVFSPRNAPKHGWGKPPSAAIVMKQTLPLELHDPSPNGEPSATLDGRDITALMERALWAATLASGGAPGFRQGYTVILSPGWIGMAAPSMGDSESFPIMIPRSQPIDRNLAPRLFQLLRPEDRLTLALSKLQSSRRRESAAERVIDLGTCIEILLMHGASDNTEISYKIGLRAAWLLGANGTERMKVFKRARALYSARSMAVHTGKEPKIRNDADPGAAYAELEAYDTLCATIIVKLTELLRWPDWARLVLDADSAP